MNQKKFVLEYQKGQPTIIIELLRRTRKMKGKTYIKDVKKRFSMPFGQGKEFHEFIKSLKFGDMISISKYEKEGLKCGLCQEKIGLDDQVRYTKVDEKVEPVHEDGCVQNLVER